METKQKQRWRSLKVHLKLKYRSHVRSRGVWFEFAKKNAYVIQKFVFSEDGCHDPNLRTMTGHF